MEAEMEARFGLLPFWSGGMEAEMEARFGLLPFWSAEMEAEMEPRFRLLPFWLGGMEAEMEARLLLLPLCFHFSRAARLNTVETGSANRIAISRRDSLLDS
jgi:hypothetical protein